MERGNERQLLQQVRRGNTEAFASLYRANVQAVFRYIAYRVNDTQLAEDLTGDVFIRALKSINTYEDQGKPFVAWLYRIAHARVVDYYRQHDRRPQSTALEEQPIEAPGDMDATLLRRHAAKVLREAISDLTEDQQQVIILRFIEGQRIETVAEQMGKQANAIKQLQHRALHALASRLERAGFDIETVLAGDGMNEYFDDPEFDAVLAQCMEDVLRQHRTIEECLQTYPHYTAQLKPLLLAGLMTSRLKAPQLSSQSVTSIEAKLRQQTRRPAQRRTGLSYGLTRLAAVLVVALLIAFGSGGGLVAASSNSLPGDPLYGIKRLWEAIVLALSPLTGPQDVLWQRIAETRLDELERLAAEGELTETAFVDFYSALYHLSGFSSAQNDPKIMTLMQNTASALITITPSPDIQPVYKDVLRLAQDNVRTGIVQPPSAELPASIIQLTALPTLIPSVTAGPSATATLTPSPTFTPTQTPIPSSTATHTASPTATDTPTVTVTPSRTPRIPATGTKTVTPTITPTFTPTVTITPTATWTDLPLPVPIFSLPVTVTPPPAVAPTDIPVNTPDIEFTRIRATEQSVFMTQTAGPPSATNPSPP